MKHNAEFRRCLEQCDVKGIRKLWQHVHPELPQPKDDADALYSIHLARVAMKTLSKKLREYSEQWLSERQVGRIAHGVGVMTLLDTPRAQSSRHEMKESVLLSHREGLDLDLDAPEVKRRMLKARARA